MSREKAADRQRDRRRIEKTRARIGAAQDNLQRLGIDGRLAVRTAAPRLADILSGDWIWYHFPGEAPSRPNPLRHHPRSTREHNRDSTDDDLSAFREVAAQMKSHEGWGGNIATFNHERGEWVTGSGDNKTIIDDRKLTAGVGLILLGWQKFVGNKPFYADVGFIRDRHKPREREELGDLDKNRWRSGVDPWRLTYFLPAGDPETRQHFMIVTNSETGKNALAALQIAFVEHNETRPSETEQWPIVVLANDGSFSTHGKKIWKPRYDIDGWTDPPLNFQAVTPPPNTIAKIEHQPNFDAVANDERTMIGATQSNGQDLDDDIPF